MHKCYSTHNRPPGGLKTINYFPLIPTIQAAFHLCTNTLIETEMSELKFMEATGDHIKSIAQVKADNSPSVLVIHRACHFLAEGNEVGQTWLAHD